MDIIVLPIIGGIGVVEIVVSFILGIFGYVLGGSIKSGIKYVFLFIAVLAVLIFFGLMTTDILSRVTEVVSALKGLLPSFMPSTSILQTLSLPLVAFVVGFSWGVLKG